MDPTPPPDRPRWSVAAVVATYFGVGMVWILASTPVADDLAGLLGISQTSIELLKGVGFVVVTAAVLYASLRHWETAYGEATRRSRSDLERREQRFRNLAEQTEGAVYRIRFTPEPELEYISPHFEEMTGLSRQELRDDLSQLVARVHPEDRDQLDLLGSDDPTRGPAAPAVSTFRFERADGEWIWIEDHHTPEIGPDGSIEADQGIAFDVTARRRQEEARAAALEHEREASEHLRRTVHAHQTFLTSISHELRTPLTGVLGFATTLEAHDASMSPEERRLLLRRLTANARRLGRLLDDLLDLDRLNRGVLQLHLQDDVDLAEVVAVLADELETPDHRVLLDVPRTSLRLDRPKVERIIDNLLRNAVKHTPPGTTISLSADLREDEVLVTVEDDGPGLDEDPARMFEPFRQGRAATTSASPGTGIGLSLVREFAAMHGGEAWHEDRDPHGARFCVLLPVGAEVTARATNPPVDAPGPGG